MKEHCRESKENTGITCMVWTLLCIACMAMMLVFASKKTIVIADAAPGQGSLPEVSASLNNSVEYQMKVDRTYDKQGVFCITLPKDVSAEQLVMENRYLDRELLIYLEAQDVKADFFVQNAISGDTTQVVSASVCEQEGILLLKIKMKHVLEYRSTMQGNTLTIAGFSPHELYDYIVLLDPACGSTVMTDAGDVLAEEHITLQIARQVLLKSTLQNVRIYLTRQEDRVLTDAERTELVADVQADFYVRLSTSEESTGPYIYGIKGLYNEEYFIPRLENVELADLLTRAVTIEASNRAIGLEPAGEDSVLRSLKIPAAEVSVGYLTNVREAELLAQEEYREKIADGIVKAIDEAVIRLKSDNS
ncbi:MAG: N-acetylmuramoyl-L-alanine amidase [Acetatifactor sp.]